MRHPIRENIRVGVPITLEPGPDRIYLFPKPLYLGPGRAYLRRQVQALRRQPRPAVMRTCAWAGYDGARSAPATGRDFWA